MLSITVFWFWCASRAPTLTHVDLSGGFGKAGARQQGLRLKVEKAMNNHPMNLERPAVIRQYFGK